MHELRDRNVALRLGSAVVAIEHSESGSIVTRLADGAQVQLGVGDVSTQS